LSGPVSRTVAAGPASLITTRAATSARSRPRSMTAPVARPSAMVIERTSLSSQTCPPAAVIAAASESQMPTVPAGQKPNVLNALLRVK
jgi:hypothetical protein